MRFRKRFPIILVVILLMFLFKFKSAADAFVNVDRFRGAEIKGTVFYPMIAKNINSSKLTVTLNDNVYTNETDDVYMSSQLNIMVPYRLLVESLHCSAHFYGENHLIILQGDNEIELKANITEMKVNGASVNIDDPMIMDRGTAYVPLQILADYLSFEYEWDLEANHAQGITEKDAKILPDSFDLRDYLRVGQVRDQGKLGTCWAFASLSALQSVLMPEETAVFSVDNMSLRSSYSSDQTSGGEYTMGMAYLTAWKGPVLEADDPYGDNVSTDGLEAVKHVQEIIFLDQDDKESIKEAIFKYGAVQSSIYMKVSNPLYYSKKNAAYFYDGDERVNHDIIIIGWDDNYKAENFASTPDGDGAFICQNSWGTGFGNDGYFYVSYYDANIGLHSICYTGVESSTNYDAIYQSDLCGYGGRLGYNKSSIYAANVFTSTHDEIIEAVGFYATGKDTSYEVYIVPKFMGKKSLSSGWKAAEGIKKEAGYYTVKLDSRIQIEEGTEFAVVIRIDTPDAMRPLAVEYASEDSGVDIDISDGKSYISSTGRKWVSTEKTQNCNICLKAYTSY